MFDPSKIQAYHFSSAKNVITSMQMERLLSPTRPYNHVMRSGDGRVPDKIAYVLCTGSRDMSIGNPVCSQICCMYSIKQAQLLMGALPMADVTIYYINIRSFGKGFEEFYEQAKGMGVNFIKGKIAKTSEKENGNLILRYEDINRGRLQEAEHDLVVLSVGVIANQDPGLLFDDGMWKKDEFDFAYQKDLLFNPSLSNIEGVFLAGTTTGPLDIPDTILSSGAASMEAIRYIEKKLYKYMKQKIGVYICHCGGNISDYVDVEKVRQAAGHEDGVVLAKTTIFACADSNQKQMVADITENKLDAVVVASCSPKLHQMTFQSVIERAGLNKFNYFHANIREQASWSHSDDKTGATEKSIQIVRSAIAKVRLSEAIEPIEIKTEQAVLVIGAGVAGMKAAVALAKTGVIVYLIEREHFIGGRIAQWDVLWTNDETGKELVTRLYNDVKAATKVTLFTGAELTECSGSKGNFDIRIQIRPRYIKEYCDQDNLKKAIKACPVEVSDAFNFNITKRQAIYHNFPSEYPQTPVIDIDNCTRCGECEEICHQVDFSQKEEVINLKAGSVLVATGFDPYTPHEGEFGFKAVNNVITLPQFKRLVAFSDSKLLWNGKPVKDIAYIYCVGSRQPDGDNKYCSRYCCTAAIYSAIKASDKINGLNHFHFTRGIRTYGKQELLYHQASIQGQVFLQSYEDDPPKVERKGGKTIVRINDILTFRKEIEMEADLVVLVTGMIPRSNSNTVEILKIPRGRDGFFNEIHMKLRPVETIIDGITIAGCCQGPKYIVESINSALSAAIKSYLFVSKDVLEIEPLVAEVNSDLCVWCDACTNACVYDAIRQVKINSKPVAIINIAVCKGCGMCLPVCPTNAIQLRTFSDQEVEQMISAMAQKL